MAFPMVKPDGPMYPSRPGSPKRSFARSAGLTSGEVANLRCFYCFVVYIYILWYIYIYYILYYNMYIYNIYIIYII